MEAKKYSYKIGFYKFLAGAVSGILVLLTLAGLTDITLWSILETYLKPVLATITISGLFGSVLNALKFRASLVKSE